MRDADRAEVAAAAGDDPCLHRGIAQVVVLHAGRRLDLDHANDAVATLQQVGADEHVAIPECRFEERHVRTAAERLLGIAQRLTQVLLRLDQDAARPQAAGHGADPMAAGEHGLGLRRVHAELPPVDVKPEAFRALPPGDDLRLGKTECARHKFILAHAADGRGGALEKRKRPAGTVVTGGDRRHDGRRPAPSAGRLPSNAPML